MGYFYSPIAGGASFWEESGDDLLSTVDGKVLLLDDTATTTETVAVLTPTTANCGLVIAPTGTGAIMADIPDGAATGGSARGNYAVDLQQDRTYNYEVASANNSVIGGGAGNRAYSTHTGVLGGLNNSVGGNYSIIAGGTSNLTLGWGSFIGGGSGNKVQTSAYASAIAAGYNNEILSGAQYSIIAAGHTNKIFGDSDYSFIGGGRLNEAFAEYNTVAGGYNNAIAGSASDYATISGGQNNDINQCAYGVIAGGTGNDMNNSNSSTISGGTSNFIITSSGCTIAGGTSHNIASGSTNSTISGGSQNDSTAVAGTVVGGLYGLTYLNGQVSNAYGRFSVTGDSQTSRISLRKEITGTTISELFLDGLSIQAVLPSNKTWNANIQLIATVSLVGNGTVVLGEGFVGNYSVGIKNLAGTTSLIGTVQDLMTEQADTNMADAVVTITADDTNDALKIEFTPPSLAGTTTEIRVVATVYLTEVAY